MKTISLSFFYFSSYTFTQTKQLNEEIFQMQYVLTILAYVLLTLSHLEDLEIVSSSDSLAK